MPHFILIGRSLTKARDEILLKQWTHSHHLKFLEEKSYATVERVKPVTWRHGKWNLKESLLNSSLILLTQVYISNVYIYLSKHRWHDKSKDWSNHCYSMQNTCKYSKPFNQNQSAYSYFSLIQQILIIFTLSQMYPHFLT